MQDPFAGRRGLLSRLAASGLGGLIAPDAFAHRYLRLLERRQAPAGAQAAASPYGPLSACADDSTGLELIELPDGFRYRSMGWTGDLMRDQQACPNRHDGMGVLPGDPDHDEWVLVRNHECWRGPVLHAPACYDDGQMPLHLNLAASGGTTNLRVRDGRLVSIEASLAGTMINCAGGTTGWGTWLSCEEIRSNARSSTGKRHGYVFEVHADPSRTRAEPITAMGRFRHEAAAVYARTGHVYLSEDDRHCSGLYRFVPDDLTGQPGSLARGGRLQAARVQGRPNADLRAPTPGERHRIEWIDIADPDADAGRLPEAGDADPSGELSGPFRQAWQQGGLRFARGEGLWIDAGMLFMADTAAGHDRLGRIGHGSGALWALDLRTQELVAMFAAAPAIAANHPDNLAISPGGGLLFCEDGQGIADDGRFGNRLMAVNPDGASFVFARNCAQLDGQALRKAGKRCAPGDYRSAEFAGACFDPNGRWLFVNLYAPGLTLAITGPWERGPLGRSGSGILAR